VTKCAHAERCVECKGRLRCRGCEPRATPTAAPNGASCLRAGCEMAVAKRSTGEPKRVVIVKPPRQAPPVPESVREACLRVLLEERRPLRAGKVAELAGTSCALAGRALRELLADWTVEHAEEAREMVGPLVRREGEEWAATHLAYERDRCALNRTVEHEATGEREVSRAVESEAERAIRELEREVESLRAKLAEVEDASFEFAA
jgi:hypothetical protein